MNPAEPQILKEKTLMEDLFGPVISSYTKEDAVEEIKSNDQWLRAFNDKVGYWLAEEFEEKQIAASRVSEFYEIYEVISPPPTMPYQDMRKLIGTWIDYSFFSLGKSFERYLAMKRRPFCLNSVKLVYSWHMESAFLALKPEFIKVEK